MRVGLRSLGRNRRRSILTALMLIIGIGLAGWSVALAEGTYDLLIRGSTLGYMGHVQLLHEKYIDKPTIHRTVPQQAPSVEQLTRHPDVVAVTFRVETGGLLAFGPRSVPVQLVGLDEKHEPDVTTIKNAISKGDWLTTETPPSEVAEKDPIPTYPLVLGSGVAKRLKADIGSELSFIGQAADGSMAAELFVVVGLYSSGADEMDAAIAFARLSDTQNMLALHGRVHRVIARLQDVDTVPSVVQSIAPQAPTVARGWRDTVVGLSNLIDADRAGYQVTIFIVVAIVMLGVANTMLMSVFERTREFAIMLALGTRRVDMVTWTLWEVAWLSLLGALGGVGLAAVLTYFVVLPLEEPMTFAGVVISDVKGAPSFKAFVFYPFLIFAISLLTGLYPALRAARLDFLTELRRTG